MEEKRRLEEAISAWLDKHSSLAIDGRSVEDQKSQLRDHAMWMAKHECDSDHGDDPCLYVDEVLDCLLDGE